MDLEVIRRKGVDLIVCLDKWQTLMNVIINFRVP